MGWGELEEGECGVVRRRDSGGRERDVGKNDETDCSKCSVDGRGCAQLLWSCIFARCNALVAYEGRKVNHWNHGWSHVVGVVIGDELDEEDGEEERARSTANMGMMTSSRYRYMYMYVCVRM